MICPDATICSTCYDTYFLNSATNLCDSCANTIANCTRCSTSTGVVVCEICSTGTTLDRTTNTCILPVQSCSANCAMCSADAKICYECSIGYYVANDFTCMTCGTIANCADCVNSTSCVACLDGFLFTSNQTCVIPCHVANC